MMGSPALGLAVDIDDVQDERHGPISSLSLLATAWHIHHGLQSIRRRMSVKAVSLSPRWGLEVNDIDRLRPRSRARLVDARRAVSLHKAGSLHWELAVSGLSWHGRTGGLALDSGG